VPDEPIRPFDDDTSLADLVNRVLDRGALITGEVVISVAGIDLIYLGLQIAISSVESLERHAWKRVVPPTHHDVGVLDPDPERPPAP
jgi:gas vesicle structural protein